MLNEYVFTIIIEKEEEGGYHAFCPLLPGCHTQGETYEEAMENIKDAIKLYIESLREHNEEVPTGIQRGIGELYGKVRIIY